MTNNKGSANASGPKNHGKRFLSDLKNSIENTEIRVLVKKKISVKQIKRTRSSINNTEILRARERSSQARRDTNDRAINIMLVIVSVTFLVLTFPYQFVWLADQIYRAKLNRKFDVNFDSRSLNDLWLYELISYTLKDIALTIRNLNFTINFFLYSTMSNLFRKELNVIFQSIGFQNFYLFKNGKPESRKNTFEFQKISVLNQSMIKSFPSMNDSNVEKEKGLP